MLRVPFQNPLRFWHNAAIGKQTHRIITMALFTTKSYETISVQNVKIVWEGLCGMLNVKRMVPGGYLDYKPYINFHPIISAAQHLISTFYSLTLRPL
jgi:hypothetical protein